MIFVTVGTDAPFDRLVREIDSWAARTGREDVFAQIGRGGWRPRHISWAEMLEPPAFRERFAAARLIVAHAGMGTILTALHSGKAILVMPKKASLGEHRNEHQTATARHLLDLEKVAVAFDESELRERLDRLDSFPPAARIDSFAQPPLLSGLRQFIHQPDLGTARIPVRALR